MTKLLKDFITFLWLPVLVFGAFYIALTTSVHPSTIILGVLAILIAGPIGWVIGKLFV